MVYQLQMEQKQEKNDIEEREKKKHQNKIRAKWEYSNT